MVWVNATINLVEREINEGGHEAIAIPDEEGAEKVTVAEEAVVVPSEQPNLLMDEELFGSFDFDKDEGRRTTRTKQRFSRMRRRRRMRRMKGIRKRAGKRRWMKAFKVGGCIARVFWRTGLANQD